jgi:hypothetical protein
MEEELVDRPPTWRELESIKPLAEVEKITSLGRDTLQRCFPHLIVDLSPRRKGMKLKFALAIADGTAPARPRPGPSRRTRNIECSVEK